MDNETLLIGDNFIIIPSNNNDDTLTTLIKNKNYDLSFKIIGLYLIFYILFTICINMINFDYNILNLSNFIPIFNNTKKSTVDNSKIDKFDIENSLDHYIETIKINQFLQDENNTNLNKVIDFYRYSTQLSTKLKNIINDKYRYIFVNAEIFYNYYGRNNSLIEVINTDDDKIVCINLHKLYCEEQLLIGKELFNINNKEKYVSLKNGDLCFLTSYARLNVVIWLIQTGFYDYLEKHFI